MAFTPLLRLITAQPSGIICIDNTGDYDASSNPGGWGAPNPAKTDVVRILQRQDTLDKPTVGGVALSVPDQATYLTGAGNLLPGAPNSDRVYDMHALIGFICPVAISSQAGSMQFTMTGADAQFATAVGFTIDALSTSIFYPIDRTKPLTGTGGYVTVALPLTVTTPITFYFDAESHALILQSGQACLMRDIAAYAGVCGGACEGEDLQALSDRYMQYLSMIQDFVIQDYTRADELAQKLQNDCGPCGCPCAPIGEVPASTPGTAGVAPVITVQPQAVNILAGQNALFTVTATGTGPLQYQWMKNGVNIPGATSQTLLLLNVPASGAALYSVIVTNQYGYAVSVNAPLTIGTALIPVTITLQPQNQSGTAGQSVTFTVNATGSPTITYQWRFNGVAIPGANSNTLVVTNVSNANVGNYDVVVSNPVNSVISVVATLSLNILAMWGFSDTIPAVVGDITGLQHSGTFPHNSTITADFTDNALPKFLIMAEPATEALKVRWFGDVNNQGPIGDPNNDTFGIPLIIGPWRVYVTVFKTAQTGEPLQFLIS